MQLCSPQKDSSNAPVRELYKAELNECMQIATIYKMLDTTSTTNMSMKSIENGKTDQSNLSLK